MSTTDKIANPSRYYANAEAVLADPGLTKADKTELLQNWANELRQLLAAEEESMEGDENNAEKLTAVEKALLELGSESEHHDAKA